MDCTQSEVSGFLSSKTKPDHREENYMIYQNTGRCCMETENPARYYHRSRLSGSAFSKAITAQLLPAAEINWFSS